MTMGVLPCLAAVLQEPKTQLTYLAMALKARSTLRPDLALVSMKGSPYSCKRLLLARRWPVGAAHSPQRQGHPPHPLLTHLS